MGKRKSFVLEPEQEAAEELPPPAEEQAEVFADDSVNKIFSVLATMNLSGGKVGIHLKRPNALKVSYEGYMTIEQFKEDGLETLKNTYGGGDYTLQFQDSNGKFVTSQNISIDPRFKGSVEPTAAPPEKLDEDRIVTAIEKNRPADNQGAGMMPLMITMFVESNKTLAAMLTANQQANSTLLSGMMSALTAAQTKPATDPVLLEFIRQKSDKTPISETIEAFATLRDLTSNGEPKEKEDMIEKFVKLVGPSLVGFFTRQGMPMMPPPPQLDAGQQAPQQQAPPPPATGAAPDDGPKLVQFTGMLLNAARRGTPAENYYDVIVDNITDDQFDLLITELKKENWLETLFGNFPEVLAQKAWFEKLRAAFLEDAGEMEDAEGREGSPLPAAAGAHGVTRPTQEAAAK